MRIIIAGTRTFNNYNLLKVKCDEIISKYKNTESIEIVCGMAMGADLLGYKYARENGYSIKEFPANWKLFGKSAGYKRNMQMADYTYVSSNKNGMLIAFWDGQSKGTKNMIDIAEKYKLKSYIIKY